jgi:hypothetical protein
MSNITVCVLFGNYLFDGRARRHVELLSLSSNILILNIGLKTDSKRTFLKAKSSNYSIECINLARFTKFNLVKHLILFLTALKLIWKTKPHTIVSLNYFTVYVSIFRSYLSKTIFIYDAYELLITDSSSTHREKFWFWLEKKFISYFDIVIEANEERAELLRQYYKLKIRNVVSVRNIPIGTDTNSDNQLTITKDAIQLGIRSNARVLIYQGDITFDRNIGKFISTLNCLPDIYQFLLIGDGPALAELKFRFSEHIKNGRLILTGRLMNDKLERYTRIGHVGIISYPFIGLNNLYCSPNKIYEYGQSGLAIICTAQYTLVNMISKYRIGELINEQDDVEVISHKVSKVFSNLIKIRANLKHFNVENTWENESSGYISILKSTKR